MMQGDRGRDNAPPHHSMVVSRHIWSQAHVCVLRAGRYVQVGLRTEHAGVRRSLTQLSLLTL